MFFIKEFDMLANRFKNYAALPLRLVLGLIFLYHGLPKLMGLEGTTQFVLALGFPSPSIFATVLALVEVFGGIFLIIGLLTRWTSVFLGIEMLFAFFLVHLKNGFSVSGGGFEFVLLILAGLATLKILGAQKLSVDSYLSKR